MSHPTLSGSHLNKNDLIPRASETVDFLYARKFIIANSLIRATVSYSRQEAVVYRIYEPLPRKEKRRILFIDSLFRPGLVNETPLSRL